MSVPLVPGVFPSHHMSVVSVGTSPTLLSSAMAGQVRLFQNQGSAIVYIGGVNVMVGTGYPLSAGLNPQPVFLDLATNGAWYAVAGSAQNVLVDSIY